MRAFCPSWIEPWRGFWGADTGEVFHEEAGARRGTRRVVRGHGLRNQSGCRNRHRRRRGRHHRQPVRQRRRPGGCHARRCRGRRHCRQRDRPQARRSRPPAGARGRVRRMGTRAGGPSGALAQPRQWSTARSSPTITISEAARAAATSCTKSGSTAARKPCAAPPAATPTAPGPRSADRERHSDETAPASAGAFLFLPCRAISKLNAIPVIPGFVPQLSG